MSASPAKIWLDDVRDAPDKTWSVARFVGDALSILNFCSVQDIPVEVLSLDHDLGNYHGNNLPTGYDLLKFLEEDAFNGDWDMIPNRFEIHSANPVGRKNMKAAIDSIERMRQTSA